MKVIAYLSYGSKQEYQLELYFSILSALQFLKAAAHDIRICVISDRPYCFSDRLGIDYLPFSQAELAEWTNHGASPHRAKILALMKVMDHYQSAVALVDSDTYFLKSPVQLMERITPQQSVLFGFEHVMKNDLLWQPLFKKLGNHIDFGEVYLNPHCTMFNAGVVGVDIANRSLLDQVLSIVDRLNATHHVFTDEQLSFSLVLNQLTQLYLSDDLIRHYWGWYERRFIHVQIARLFKELTSENLERLVFDATPVVFEDCPPVDFRDRLISKIRGLIHRWDQHYKFAYFSYRNALSYAAKDQAYANAWAAHTLQGVTKSLASSSPSPKMWQHLQRDFPSFSQPSIAALDWLSTEMKNEWLDFWQQRFTPKS
ncbi:MAG: hypothetical protein MUC48_04625 [Leptolyngbya sp. Prado105]|jgi:hypothetical protein|nr:hypothetical protein [Leptolyngbya sp. Prado105]